MGVGVLLCVGYDSQKVIGQLHHGNESSLSKHVSGGPRPRIQCNTSKITRLYIYTSKNHLSFQAGFSRYEMMQYAGMWVPKVHILGT